MQKLADRQTHQIPRNLQPNVTAICRTRGCTEAEFVSDALRSAVMNATTRAPEQAQNVASNDVGRDLRVGDTHNHFTLNAPIFSGNVLNFPRKLLLKLFPGSLPKDIATAAVFGLVFGVAITIAWAVLSK